ncbi:MAG: hypothetical protein AAFY15_11525, partial [Cyanobacteria bacterium J06648_11]
LDAPATDDDDDELADSLAGKTYSRQERLELEMETLARHFARRRELLEGALTAPDVARLLGTSRQTPHDRLRSQSLLAIKHNGKLMFPRWQFDPAGPDGVIDGLPEVLKALRLSDYSKLTWLARPNPYFESRTPVELLRQGERERVVREAAAVGAEVMQPDRVPA